MLPISLALKPGVDGQSTALQTGAGVQDSNLIRNKQGLIQKLGGCQRLSNSMFYGVARALMPWVDLAGNGYLGIGTSELLQIYALGEVISITPVETSSDLTAPFTTTAGSSIVTVTDAFFAPSVGQWIDIANAMYVDGIVLQGTYKILTTGVNVYTIDAGHAAIAGVAGGGTAVEFTTTLAASDVDVTLGAHVFLDQEVLTIGVSTIVGGITFFGPYTVTVTAGPVYTIDGGAAAGAGATGQENGGDARINYLLLLPLDTTTTGNYGTGLYGVGPYGVASTSSMPVPQVRWTLDKWGENLIAAYAGGTLYEWVPPISPGNVATPVAGAPSAMNGVFVAAPQQQAIAWGAYSATLGEQDPLLLAWCDVADLNDWTPTAINQAGSFRLSSGSQILSGFWLGVNGLIWTDLDFWLMSYVGFPIIYGFNKVSSNCGLLSQRCAGAAGNTVAWLSQNEFFVYSGGSVTMLPCSLHDFVFNNIDMSFADSAFCASSASMGELVWWFPTIGSEGVCNAYVKWNVSENLWDGGLNGLELSAWTDQSVLGLPIGADYNFLLQQFETSNDFDGVVLDSYILTGWFQLAEGEEFLFIERILPDFTLNEGGQIALTIYVADYIAPTPGAAYPVRTYGPYTVTETTPYIIVRARGRVMQMRLDSLSQNTFWRYGKPLAVVAVDGRR